MLTSFPVGRFGTIGSRASLLVGASTLLSAALLLLVPHTAMAAPNAPTRFVSVAGNDNGGANNCSNKNTPCATIQRAVNAANNGDEIAVAAGTYSENVVVNGRSVTLNGGWNATFDTRDVANNITIIDGQNANTVLCFDGGTSTVDGFTITNGNASATSDSAFACGSLSSHGGGVLVRDGANVTISNNTVISNVANRRGGGIFVLNSDALISNNKVLSNTAKQGGGIWGGGENIDNFTPSNNFITVLDNEIGNNTTITNTDNSIQFDSDGAGLQLTFGSQSLVQGNLIYLNRILAPDGYGAALRVQFGSTSVISNNRILSNTCFISPTNQFASTLGGGMELVEASAQIINNYWENNANVAIKVDNAPYAIIDGNTVVRNRSDRGGAGIWIIRQTVFTITNNIIAENEASGINDGGGGINLNDVGQHGVGSGLIANNKIYGNVSNNHAGGGIGMVGMPGPLIIRNNQIYNNDARDGSGMALEMAQNVQVDGNLVHHNGSNSFTSGIFIRGITPNTTTTSIVSLTNNAIYKNDDYGVNSQNVGNLSLINNTIADNFGAGVSAYPSGGGANTVLQNNIISHNDGCALRNGPFNFIGPDSNLFYGNGGSGCTTINNGVFSDPQYASLASDDYRLTLGSPAIDAGNDSGAPNKDILSIVRPQGAKVDIGAYEFANLQNQTITFGQLNNQFANVVPFNINASASSNLSIIFSASGSCSVAPVNGTNATVTLSGTVGSCTITASQPGNNVYAAATPVAHTFQILSVAQSIQFDSLPNRVVGDVPFTVVATATSGLPVSFANSGVCSLAGNQVSLTGFGGTCTITATQPGNLMYAAATPVVRSFTVRQQQSISFIAPASKQTTDPAFALTATASSGLAVAYSSATSGICTVNGNTVTLQGSAGSCTIVATQNGNSSFVPAAPVTRTIAVGLQAQTIAFDGIVDRHATDEAFTVIATATSGLPVSFSSDGECSVKGNLVMLTGIPGQCTLTALQTGNGTYAAATPVSQQFAILALAQIIHFDPLPNHLINDAPFALTGTSSSGLTVIYQAQGPCQVFGVQVVLAGSTGICTITATQPGTLVYLPAAPVVQSFAIDNPFKITQTITVTPVADAMADRLPITLSAVSSSGLKVTYSAVTPNVCTVAENIVTLHSAGTCEINALQSGNDTYNPAETVRIIFTVHAANHWVFIPRASR